jgi:DNA-binding LacI/PurR family transcriptional regulator
MSGKTKSHRVTAQRIGELAGVSAATVSLVLNNRADALRIAPETQQRVADAARKLNYVPNYLARGLSGASTRTIGLLWPLGGAPGNAQIAYHLVQNLAKQGYLSFLTDAIGDPHYTQRCLADLEQRSVDGIIVYAGGPVLQNKNICRALERFPRAVVIAARTMDLATDFIHHDRQAAMRKVADHFVDSGRQQMAVLTVGQANPTKIEAFTQQLAKRGVPRRNLVVLQAEFRDDRRLVDDAIALLESRYPQGKPSFDALACTDDDLAAGVTSWLQSRGVRVPQDVAVTGFNNVGMGRHLTPALATVERNDEQVAHLAEQMILARIADPKAPWRREAVPMTFLWRTSAGEPAPREHSSHHSHPQGRPSRTLDGNGALP